MRSKSRDNKDFRIYLLYALFLIFIVLYVTSNSNIIFGIAAFLMIMIIIVAEIRLSVGAEGLRKTVTDIVISIVAAMVLLWLIPSLILHTNAPIDVVASCSMLPVMHKGDLVLLSGVGNLTSFLELKHIPVVNLSRSSFSSMISNMNSEFVEPFAYFNGNRSAITATPVNGSSYNVAFYGTRCINTYTYLKQPYNYARCYADPSLLSSNLIRYNYSVGRLEAAGQNLNVIYISSITIANTIIAENYSNPIIVYRATSNDYFSGDIIHRLYAAIRVGDDYYLLTKGDNNPVLDIEAMNYPINRTNLIGYVIADIPYLGYPSLIIKGQIGNVPGCNQAIVR